jgi:hypothetical protein
MLELEGNRPPVLPESTYFLARIPLNDNKIVLLHPSKIEKHIRSFPIHIVETHAYCQSKEYLEINGLFTRI